uniref:Transmembrane channel-like protein 3 n=1 Tax=Phallusia mammillata TaxID=59560 RepID=A0A6F9DVH8_9ASCI|nr:transmembrane channel-like protein 3 [Phallusia mammillata]
MGIITTAFLVVPEILVGNQKHEYKVVPEMEKSTAWDLNTIWSLGGHIQRSVLFYGFYTNDRVIGNGYRLPLAYFLVGISLFAYSFAALLRKMAKNSRMNRSASSEDDFTFSWRLFSSWDYMIGNPETAENKAAEIATSIREAIVEEQEKEKQENNQRALRIFLRILANILVLLLLAGSLYSIQFAVSRAQSLETEGRESTFYEQNEVSIIVTAVTIITPSLFELIGSMEQYHPRNALRIQLARILMLYLANLYSLMIGLLGHVAEATAQQRVFPENVSSHKGYLTSGNMTSQYFRDLNTSAKTFNQSNVATQNTECWETQIGQELMKLSVIDFISTVLTILIVDFFRALFVRYMNRCWCWDLEKKFPEYGEFKIAENVLHLIYNQGITWVGSFFCPLLPMLNVVKLILMMYLRSWAVTTCNIPHQRVFRASRSNNFYLAMLLFMLFLSLLPTVWVIVRHSPSGCGPFSNRRWMYTIISETLEEDVPSWFREAAGYLTTPVVILPAILLLVMIIYYLQAVASSTKEANSRLKLQLHYERKEGKKNFFQLGAGKLQQQASREMLKKPSLVSNVLTPIEEDSTNDAMTSQKSCNDPQEDNFHDSTETPSRRIGGRRKSIRIKPERHHHADRNRLTRQSLDVASNHATELLKDDSYNTVPLRHTHSDKHVTVDDVTAHDVTSERQDRQSQDYRPNTLETTRYFDVEDDITMGSDSTNWPRPAPRRTKQRRLSTDKGKSPQGNAPSPFVRSGYLSSDGGYPGSSVSPRSQRFIRESPYLDSPGRKESYVVMSESDHRGPDEGRNLNKSSEHRETSSGKSTPVLIKVEDRGIHEADTAQREIIQTPDGYMIVERNCPDSLVRCETPTRRPKHPHIYYSPTNREQRSFCKASSSETQDPSETDSLSSRSYVTSDVLRMCRKRYATPLDVRQESLDGDFVYVIDPGNNYIRMTSPGRHHVRKLVGRKFHDNYVYVSETPSATSSRRSSFNDVSRKVSFNRMRRQDTSGSPAPLPHFIDEADERITSFSADLHQDNSSAARNECSKANE